jgi:CRISPR-associated protein (Cas_Cmr5)
MRKDQMRAIGAYKFVRDEQTAGRLDKYEGAVQTFAATVLRSGLAVAVSVLERNREDDGPKQLLSHLEDPAWGGVPGIPIQRPERESWPSRVRAIENVTDYMLATRELLAIATWLRRACRALKKPET